MANDELVEKIGKLIEPVRTQLYEQGANIVRLVQGQKRLEQGQKDQGSTLAQIKTAVEALAAGQHDLREQVKTLSGNVATKADVQDMKADRARDRKRIENLEENTKTPNPHKN